MFVDNNLIAEIDEHMLQAMTASVEALFLVKGPDKLLIRRSNLSMDKFYQATCSPAKGQLGIIIDTNEMIVKMTPQKITALKTEPANQHSQRKSFTLKQIGTLLGTLDHSCQVYPWPRFLFIAIRVSVLKLMREKKTGYT